MTQFMHKTSFVAHFFVISSIIIVLTASTKIKSNHYSVWRYEEQRTIKRGNESDETTNVTFDVKIRGTFTTVRHENNNAWRKNQYNLVVKFRNVLWFLNNNVNYHHAEEDEQYGVELGADGRCTSLYTKTHDNEIDLKRTVALLLFPEPHYKMNDMKMYSKNKNRLSDCFEVTPLGHCKTFVQATQMKDEGVVVVTKHTNADYCDEEEAVYESLTTFARPSIQPDSSLDVKYLIDQTDNKLSRVEMIFKINYPTESVQNSYVLTFKEYEFDEEDNNDIDEALPVS